ncbi:MAG TPA: IPTL-CTERM sorting domain-containing protein [Thermodesulfobacteriota bacterium]|nr:IPTL-CTERM sorting domain-containing protein [Thermodesulfobacteriota bacterium]
MKLFIQVCFTITLLMFLGINVQTASAGVPINTTERGWYDNLGDHTPSNTNYIAGAENNEIFHDFFVFDLSSTQICAASLVLFNPNVGPGPFPGYISPDPTETFSIYDVTTNIANLIAGTAGVAAYNDLGGGVSFGSTTVSAADNGQFVTVNLNNDGINALNAAAGGQIAIGGALTTQGQIFESELVFGSTNTDDPQDGNTFLNLEFCTTGPITIIPTMGQWGIVIATILLGFFAVIRLRRVKDSELE